MTQLNRLKAWFEVYDRINPLQAWQELGIYRLSDAIYKLRKKGFNIETHEISVRNKFKEECKVAEYVLVKGE